MITTSNLSLLRKTELDSGLYLSGSKLGWILSGRFGKRACNESNASMLIFSCPNQTTLEPVPLSENSLVLSDQNIDDFWRLENIGIKDPFIDADDSKALQHFNDTVMFKDNRYHVTWPWRDDVTDELPENFELAMGKLRSLLKRMKQTPELLIKYSETIQVQLELKKLIQGNITCYTTPSLLPQSSRLRFSSFMTALQRQRKILKVSVNVF